MVSILSSGMPFDLFIIIGSRRIYPDVLFCVDYTRYVYDACSYHGDAFWGT